LHQQRGDAGEPLVLLARRLHGSAPLVFGLARSGTPRASSSSTKCG
jgi:hypothetical protein